MIDLPARPRLLLFAGLLLPGSLAHATEVAIVGAHVDAWDEQQNLDAADRIADSLAATGRFEPVRPSDVRTRLAGREALVLQRAFLGQGEIAFNEGRVLYQRAEFEDAMAALANAVSLLKEGQAVATDNKLLLDALLLQGLTHFSIGDNDPARVAFEELVRLDPSRRLDPVNYSTPTVAFFEEIREAVIARGNGTLRVEADEGDQVYVDGRARGTGEVILGDLPVGRHTVLVLAKGGARDFHEVDITKDKPTKVSVKATQGFLVEHADDDTARARQTGLLYQALGHFAETDLVLLAGETGDDKLRVQLLDTRTGIWSQSFQTGGGDPATDLADAARGLAGYLDAAGNVDADKVSPRAIPLDIDANALLLDLLLDPQPLVAEGTLPVAGVVEDDRKGGVPWWVWAGGGVLLAGGGTTAALLITQQPEPTGTGTVVVGPMP